MLLQRKKEGGRKTDMKKKEKERNNQFHGDFELREIKEMIPIKQDGRPQRTENAWL